MLSWRAMCSDRRRVRISPVLGLIGSGLLLSTVLASRSSSGIVLGRYSPGLASLAAALVLVASGSIALLSGLKPLRRIRVWAAAFPEFAAVILVVFPVPLFLMFWFLFPFPLIEKWEGFIGTCLLLASPGVLCVESRSGKPLSDALKGILVTAVSFAICLVLAEVVIRSVVPGSFFNPRLGLIPHAKYTIDVALPGVSRGGTLSTNRWGLRGDEPPDQWESFTTIVTVGGSTTANYYLDDSRTWSSVLQNTLRESDSLVWVGNGGIPMHSSEHHDFFLREVVARIKPDVVVFLLGANDIGQFMKGEVALHEAPLPERGIREMMFRGSRLLQTMYKAKKVYIDRAPVISETVDPEFVLLPMTGPERPLPDDLREMLPDPDAYPRRIGTLINTCRELGVTPVFLTQPLLFEDNPYWRGIQGGSFWHGGPDSLFSAASHWVMLDFLNSELMRVCRDEGVACYDLASVVPHDTSMFYDSMHLTEAGAEMVGKSVAGFLFSIGILETH